MLGVAARACIKPVGVVGTSDVGELELESGRCTALAGENVLLSTSICAEIWALVSAPMVPSVTTWK